MKKKLLFTFFILFVYVMLRHVPLIGVVVEDTSADATSFLDQVLTGATNTGMLTLGLGPYMIAMLVFSVYSFMNRDTLQKYSTKDINRRMYILLAIIALIQAYTRLRSMNIVGSPIVVYIQMLLGVVCIVILARLNQEHGYGAMTVFVLANTFLNNMQGAAYVIQNFSFALLYEYRMILAYIVFAALVIFFLTKSEYRIPMERVMINNTYKKDSYISFSLAPVGMMPSMFGMSLFMLPAILFRFVLTFFPNWTWLQAIANVWSINNSIGVIIFYIFFIGLTLLLSYIMLDPVNMAEGMRKSGDCITGVSPGYATEVILKRTVNVLSVFSGIVIGAVILIPVVGSSSGNYQSMVSFLIVYGLTLNLIEEIKTERIKEKYRKKEIVDRLHSF